MLLSHSRIAEHRKFFVSDLKLDQVPLTATTDGDEDRNLRLPGSVNRCYGQAAPGKNSNAFR
jgi:hypothetical protein